MHTKSLSLKLTPYSNFHYFQELNFQVKIKFYRFFFWFWAWFRIANEGSAPSRHDMPKKRLCCYCWYYPPEFFSCTYLNLSFSLLNLLSWRPNTTRYNGTTNFWNYKYSKENASARRKAERHECVFQGVYMSVLVSVTSRKHSLHLLLRSPYWASQPISIVKNIISYIMLLIFSINMNLSLHQSLNLYKLLEILLNLSIQLTNLAKFRAIYTNWEIDAKIDSY